MKRIALTGKYGTGKFTLVSDRDFSFGNFWVDDKGYVRTGHSGLRLSRLVTKAKPNEQVDHINGDKLDNRRSNLRICSTSENCQNRNKRKNSLNKFKGVFWRARNKKWVAQIGINNKIVYLGIFNTELEAVRVYNEAVLKYHGKFGRINIL